ncbi:MAG TPA: hypothetical protein VNY73_11235 [Bacteroidia bacterium]|jgi:hypothetical protein|nr:hypothetical protein [Bacteroidia bacterium]
MLRTLFYVLSFCLFSFLCFSQEKKQSVNYEKEGYVKATVIHYKVDGCGFLLELADKEKTKLAPDKLADSFKINKLKVWLKYSPAKSQPMSTCMAGKPCEIIDVKKRK